MPLWVPQCVLATGGSRFANIYDELFCHGLYESPKPLPAAPRIVDVGGHLGLASLYFLSRYPGCRLTAIEPNPSLAALLRQNLSAWPERTRVIEAALSLYTGTIEFNVLADNALAVTGGVENRELPGQTVVKLTVPCVDAREILAEPVDLLKLDVEGHEYQLLSLALFEPAHIKNLVVEFHDIHQHQQEFADVTRLLVRERGYRIASSDNVELSDSSLRELSGCAIIKLY
jgi:FkbM family methyltransferase